ncbi:MAG: hypothetical protein QG639_693 [Patescibacteria group bacterium]|nr:hypothetical protein [Patescibacteria group bacterium]
MLEDRSGPKVEITQQQYQELLDYFGVLAVVLYMIDMINEAYIRQVFTKEDLLKMFKTLSVPCITALNKLHEDHEYFEQILSLKDLIEERTENLQSLTVADVPLLLASILRAATIDKQSIYSLTILQKYLDDH